MINFIKKIIKYIKTTHIIENKYFMICCYMCALILWIIIVPYIINSMRMVASISILLGIIGGGWILWLILHKNIFPTVLDSNIGKIDTYVLKTEAEINDKK